MQKEFFENIGKIPYEGKNSTNPLHSNTTIPMRLSAARQ